MGWYMLAFLFIARGPNRYRTAQEVIDFCMTMGLSDKSAYALLQRLREAKLVEVIPHPMGHTGQVHRLTEAGIEEADKLMGGTTETD